MTVPPPAAAFAAGWALSGAPVCDLTTEGMRAVALHGPEVTEATLRLGQLTGTWKQVYDRQDALYATWNKKLRRIWLELIAGVAVARAVDSFRQQAYMQDGSAPGSEYTDPQARQQRRQELRDLALAAATGMLAVLPSLDSWDDFLAAVAGMLAAASGEGFAAALALAAADAGQAPFDWDAAQRAGQQEPSGVETSIVAGVLVSAMASVISRSLAALAAAGATAAEMTADILGMLKDATALGVSATHAMASALGTAVSALYATAGVDQVNWLTAGINTCLACDALEAANPHPATIPPPPLHTNCRCWLTSVQRLPASAFAPYLTST